MILYLNFIMMPRLKEMLSMAKIDYSKQPKLLFAIFNNNYRKTDKHPTKTGVIKFERPFLEAMVAQAKLGEMPELKVAIWNRVSQAGVEYENAQLELKPMKTNGTLSPDKDDDGLPF